MSTSYLGSLLGTQNYTGSVDSAEPSELHFNIPDRGSFSASLTGLSDNADIQLRNNQGTVLASSPLTGMTPDAINVEQLPAGDYWLQIVAAGSNTNYQLSLTVDPLTGLSVESGFFTVGETGKVGIDFLYDGGSYEGEIAIFSLKGMAVYNAGSPNFIKEAARRALSNSVEGHVVIDDSTQGAKLSGRLPWESNFNRGNYQGVQTFAMTPGDEFGIMLVPAGKVQEVFDNPSVGGDKRPLFSLATANPLEGFQVGQIADVTGDGRTFVMEDVRVDLASDKDYNDIVFRVTGAKGVAKKLDELINPNRDWRTEKIGELLRDSINTAPQGLEFITKEIYTAGEKISLTGGKVLDENGDLSKILFWLKKEGEEWVEMSDVTQFSPDIEGWTSFNYDLKDLSAGNYQLKAIAIDELGKTSNEVIQSFRINAAPLDLELNLPQTAYKIGESVKLIGGKVYDADGVADLAKVSVWVRLAGSEWTQLADVTSFSAEGDNWATFNCSLNELAAGSYDVKAIAYDQAGDVSNEVLQSFTIIDEPVVTPINTPPRALQGSVYPYYQVGELIGLMGAKVYDPNGVSDLEKVCFRLQIAGGNWQEFGTVKEFNSDGEGWGYFNYSFSNLAAGTYRLEAVAYDSAGNASNKVIQTFTVLTADDVPVNPNFNRPPEDLDFSIFPIYTNKETISFSGAKVYDKDGYNDIKRIDYWIQKPNGEWIDIKDVTEFKVDNKDWTRFDFSYELTGLAPGKYQLWAVAYDRAGNTSNIASEYFSIITDSGEGELSDDVRLAIAEAGNLENYDPEPLSETREWVVWVTPGQSSQELAAKIGAQDLGATGHILNTYIWKFPDTATPDIVANQLVTVRGVEFAYPLVPVRLKLLSEPPTDILFKEGHQWNVEKANIPSIWPNVRGKGITIAIIDDGVEEQLELKDRYNKALSWDFNDNDPDASPSSITTFKSDLSNRKSTMSPLTATFNLPVTLTGKVTNVETRFNLSKTTSRNLPRLEDLQIVLRSPSKPADNPLNWQRVTTFYRFPGWHDLKFARETKLKIRKNGSVEFEREVFDGTYAGGVWQLEVKNPNLNQYSQAQLQQLVTDLIQNWSLTIETENPHGTAVAGISVAAENGMGIVGVAPEAELVSLRLIGSTDPLNYDKDITGKTIAAALFTQFRNQESDILNGSWGPMNMVQQSLALAALKQGVTQGRNGLGNIYVFAAGNDGALDRNVNYNYFANSRYTIAVGAASRNDVQSPYSTPGSALLISAYSDNGSGESAESIMTTALDNWYADDFGGTSAAAPLVSGIVALMLEANPNLTWRDVQHILVQTARRDGITDPAANWSGKEGDAIRHSDKYGFGIIDAAAAVNLARNWTSVAAEVPVIREFELDSVNQVIPTLGNLPVGDRLTAADSTMIQQNIKVESVEVGLSLTHPDWRDLTVVLTSPTGTQSILAKAIPPEKRTPDDDIKGGETRKYWTFNSVRHWGESSKGEWTLQVFDQQGNEVEGNWHNWKLNIHGTSNEPQPNVTIRTTDANAIEDGNAAQFVVTRDGDLSNPLTVNYAIDGTALNGTDYKQLTGTVTIEAGRASATIGIVPNLDYLTEEDETVTLTLRDTNTYNVGAQNYATATITNSTPTDWYGPFVYVNPANGHLYLLTQPDSWLGAQQQAEALGGHLVAINNAEEQNWLNETFGDYLGLIGLTDHEIYGATEGNFVWTSGEPLTYTNWQAGEPNNFLATPNGEEIVHANPANGGQWIDSSVELAIQEGWLSLGIIEIDPASLTQPIVNIHVTDSQAGEDGNAGQILIQRIGKLDEDLTVNYTVAGSATNGVDYQELTGTATIAAGTSFVIIPITTLVDNQLGENERIAISLAAGNYEIGTKPVGEIAIADQHPINRISNEVIGRNVDVPYWTQRWQNGETLEKLRIAIIEAANDGQGNYEAETKIKEIYQDVLGREAEGTEVANWRSRLEAGATLSQVRQELQGQEFIPTLNYVYTNPANGHRYVLTTPDSWLGAQAQAKALGGNLVSINDADENQWLVDTFNNVRSWMGLTDSPIYKTTEGNYKWVNGDLATYTNWYPIAPNIAPNNAPLTIEGEDFGEMNFEAPGRWNDLPQRQGWTLPGLVEIEPPPQENTQEPNAVGVVTIGATPIVDVAMGGEVI